MPLPLGGYGGCQVTMVEEKRLSVCLLAWYSDGVPTLDDLSAAGPWWLDHHAHQGRPAHISIDSSAPQPPGLTWLGKVPLHPDTPNETSSYSGWSYLAQQAVLQRRWDQRLPPEAKQAYKAAENHLSQPVEIDLGEGPTERPTGTNLLDLRDHGSVRWATLDALPQLTKLSWEGKERGLLGFLVAKPVVSDLYWTDPPTAVDLTETALTDLSFHGSAPKSLHLPAGLMHLTLPNAPTEVVAQDDGRWIRLTTSQPFIPAGLTGVRDLRLNVQGEATLTGLEELADLESLHIRWSGPPGTLTDPETLGVFDHLESLQLTDAYGLEDVEALPAPGVLRHFTINGVRKSVAKDLRARYRKSATTLSLHGAKSDTWLAVNLTNPLRDWVDDDERAGAAACKAYGDALRGIERDSGTAEATLQRLVERLNAIDERHGIIDTLRREQAGDAFMDLAARAGIPDARAADWFDDWRDF
ncbi:hypothetical protein [Actinoallomurus acanthiterrae]